MYVTNHLAKLSLPSGVGESHTSLTGWDLGGARSLVLGIR